MRIKGLIESAGTNSLHAQLGAERDSFLAALSHRDGLEGISAFLEKRPAVYK
jgi:enoyl-CoA hydratase/carnithine racemase